MQKKQEQQEALVCYLEEMIVLTDEDVETIRAASETDPWADQGINEAEGYGYVYPAKYWDDPGEEMTIPEGIRGERRLGWWVDGIISDQVLHHLRETLGQQRLWRAWSNSDFVLVLPDVGYTYPLDDPLLEQLASQLSLKEEEPARFEVIYTAHIEYGTEIAARTLESAEGESERIYENTDFADYEVESHDEHWKPLNPAARRLLEHREREENQQRLEQLRVKLAQHQEEKILPDLSPSDLKERVFALLQQQLAAFNALTEKQARGERDYRDFSALVDDANLVKATLTILSNILSIPTFSMEWALAVIKDHYCSAPQLPDEYYQRLVAWFTSPHVFLDLGSFHFIAERIR
jgi:hypothetical protein